MELVISHYGHGKLHDHVLLMYVCVIVVMATQQRSNRVHQNLMIFIFIGTKFTWKSSGS